MIDLAGQPCPICEQTSSDVLHRTTYPEFGYAGTFIMRRCQGCGLLFNSPRLDPDQLANLYGRNYYFFARTASEEFNRIVKMYLRTLALLNESRLPAKRLMDIGCGRGYFPAVLKHLGWDAAGVEISPDASRFARDRLGLNVFTGTVEQYAGRNPRQFPVVTAIDVLEHVPSPGEFIRSAASLVETGGRLIIDTPNAAAANIARRGVLWKGFNPFHVFLFSIENLTSLLSRHGLVIEQSFSYNNKPWTPGTRDSIMAGLRAIGLFPMAARFYLVLKRLTAASDSNPDKYVSRTALRIQSQSAYTSCADNAGPLAVRRTGDNIVLIARKL